MRSIYRSAAEVGVAVLVRLGRGATAVVVGPALLGLGGAIWPVRDTTAE